MYTLYCQNGTRATAAHMVLAEGNLPYRLQEVDITRDEHRSDAYLSINPRATIPALTDESGTLACETIAIMLYLADRHQLSELAPATTHPQRATLLDWLVYHSGEVQEPVKRSFYAHRHALREDDIQAVRAKENEAFAKHWSIVETHLRRNGPYHLGERFSLVDIYLLVSGTYSSALVESSSFPAISNCVERTAQRPRIAPILKQHMTGLSRIAQKGVPR